jgi:hypothetical protein
MAKLGDLVVRIGADTRDLNKSLGKVQRNMRSMTSNFKKLGSSMTRSITLPLAAVAGASLKLAVDFESSMAKVKAVTGATAGDFKSLEETAKKLGSTTVFTAKEVAGLMLEYGKLGFSTKQIEDAAEATLLLAQATGSDLVQAAEVAGSTLGGFGLAATETGRLADVMAAAFTGSALDINKFQDSMKFVAPVAKAAGVSLEEASAMLGVMADSGIKGSQAGTALRRILQELSGESGTVTEKLQKLSNKGLGVKDAFDEVGRNASSALLVLSKGVTDVASFTTELENSGGAAKDMADIMNETSAGSLKKMTSALEGAALVIGDALAPIMTDLASFVTDLATGFKNLGSGAQKTVIIFAAFLAGLGPLLVAIPSLISGISAVGVGFVALKAKVLALNLALLANPYVIAGAAIVALGAILVKTSGDIKNSRKETNLFIESLKGLDKQATINAVNEKIRQKTDELTKATKSLEISKIQAARATDKFDRQIANQSVSRYTNIVEGLNGALEDLEVALEDANAVEVDSFVNTTAIESDEESLKTFGDGVSDITAKLFELQGMGTTSFATLSNGIQDFVVSSTPQLLAFLNDFEVAVENTTEKVADSVKTMAEDINKFIEQAVESILIGMAEMVGAAIGAQRPIENVGKFIGVVLADMAINIGKYAIMHGVVIEAIRESFETLNGYLVVAAGIALIALGAGVKSNLSKAATDAGVPALAEGGLIYGPSLALVGDNKNASIDPEVVAPLSKLKGMLGGNSVQVYGRISGDDIVLSNSRASRDRNRF